METGAPRSFITCQSSIALLAIRSARSALRPPELSFDLSNLVGVRSCFVTSMFHFHPQDWRMRWLHLQKFEKGWRGLTSVFLLRLLGQSWDEGSGCANSTLCWWGALWQGQRFAHVFPQHRMQRMKNENLLSHRRIATTLLKYLDSRLLPLLSMGHNQWFHKKLSLANSHQSRIPYMATASTSVTHETLPSSNELRLLAAGRPCTSATCSKHRHYVQPTGQLPRGMVDRAGKAWKSYKMTDSSMTVWDLNVTQSSPGSNYNETTVDLFNCQINTWMMRAMTPV